ncbi:MAG: hypothetical protein GX542_12780 [Rhodococcus sp.]|nr:hypothetical protein [Rhodococcus sp. (in: high G+C Gram-positive bacteria)]
MVETENSPEPVRSTASAVVLALPAIIFLTLYLWIGVGLVTSMVFGVLRSGLLGAVVAAILAVPSLVINVRLIGTCIEVERKSR